MSQGTREGKVNQMDGRSRNSPPRVLVVEDDQGVTRMLRFSLRSAGFDITETTTGQEALNILDRQRPEAVVLDLGLPDGKGGEVLHRLLSGEQQSNGLPVWVVISALDREEAATRYGPLGDHFLSKPFDPWDLVGILEQLLISAS